MLHRKGCRAAALALAVSVLASQAQARPFRVNQIPNGPVAACFTCHVYPGGPRNAFGAAVESYGGVGFLIGGNVQWGTLALPDPAHPAEPPKTLAELDSDGDGRTNGEELLDPSGTWRVGASDPGAPSLVRLPGLIDRPVIIRQIYTSGGSSGAAYDRDFVELYNRSTSPVSLAGWSLQLASAFGGAFFGSSPATLTPLPAINLAPGQSLQLQGPPPL